MRLARYALTALLCAALPMAAAVERCARPDELRALNARVLQTRLVVTALACGAQPRYNAVVTALRPALRRQGAALRAYFRRAYGQGAEARLDGFVTRLANEQSLASSANRAAYCAAGAAAFTALEAAHAAELERRLDDSSLAAAHRIAACPPPVAARAIQRHAGGGAVTAVPFAGAKGTPRPSAE
ncbi:MAG: hypothetical protein HY749_24665 [Gammaproteobacteria bacterium]|nr:hypothetical protein [Gammaproteobacteria bacterium]MBI5619166.1 hypothetical protein [Gammaproteobacteria bacterium]